MLYSQELAKLVRLVAANNTFPPSQNDAQPPIVDGFEENLDMPLDKAVVVGLAIGDSLGLQCAMSFYFVLTLS